MISKDLSANSDYWKNKSANLNKVYKLKEAPPLHQRIIIGAEELNYFYKLTNKNSIAQYTVITAIYSFLLKRLIHGFEGVMLSSDPQANLPDAAIFLSYNIDLNNSFKNHLQKTKSEILETLAHTDHASMAFKKQVAKNLYTFSNYSIHINSNTAFDCNGILFNAVHKEGGELEIQISYIENFVNGIVINCLISCFHDFIMNLESNMDIHLSAYPLVSEEQRQQVLINFNATKIDYPSDKTILHLFEEQVAKTADNTALVFEGKEISYKELNRRVDQLAASLFLNFKINKGDVIGVLLTKSAESIISFLAVLKLGAIYLPIDTTYPEERINYIIADSCLTLLLTNRTFTGIASCPTVDIESLVLMPVSESGFPIAPASTDLAYIIYTSGSTGHPKGVMIEHHSAVNMVLAQIGFFEINAADRVVWFASVAFDASISEILMCLHSGASLYIPDTRIIQDSRKFARYINDSAITVATFPPSYLDLLTSEDVKGLRCIITAGEAANPVKAMEMVQQGIDYYNAYGPTECAVCTTIHKVNLSDMGVKNLSIGKPISNMKVYILDEDLQVLPIGVIGKLYVSGAGLSRGYVNKPNLTTEKFILNPFEDGMQLYDTGDLACWLPGGNIEFAGRKDMQVKIRGYRIELGEIETQVLQYSKDMKQAVVSVKVNNGEKVLVAYYVSKAVIDKTELRSFLQRCLPDYMIPNFFVELKKLPLTPNGKIDRKALPDITDEATIRREYLAPSTKIEKELAAIWKDVLGIDRIGVNDNFFELGGHSLMVGQVINRIQKKTGRTVSFKVFFANPSISSLGRQLQISNYEKINKTPAQSSYPVTASQNRIWVLSQLEGGSLAYNMPAVVSLSGTLNVSRFKESFSLLIDRHEILRTVFKTNEAGELRQHILSLKEFKFEISEDELPADKNDKTTINTYLQSKNDIAFDLENGPLLTASLIKLKEQQHLFFLSLHHIIGDGWSIELMVAELVKIYNSFVNGNELKLPPLSIQYKDYAVWLNEELSTEKYHLSEAYWLNQFSGELPVLTLPSFRSRPVIQTYTGNRITHHFSADLLNRLKSFSVTHDVTLFMTLMTGVNIILHKYSGQKDIILGTPIAGREHADLENQLGLYLNTLAIRSRISGSDDFMSLLGAQKDTLLNAYEHQRYPFYLLVNKLNLKRDPSRSALFDVLVILQNQHQLKNINQEEFINLNVSHYDFNSHTSQFDISFIFSEAAAGLDLTLQYNTAIYDSSLIERMFAHFENILVQALESPTILVQEMQYLTKNERHQLLVEFNNTNADYPTGKTLVDVVEEQVNRTPHAIAIVAETKVLTYQELHEQSNQLAHYLIENYSIERNNLIGVKLERTEKMVIVLLGILKSGAAYVPIDPSYPQDRISYIEQDSDCKVVVDELKLEEFDAVREKYSKTGIKRIAHPADLAYVIYTSGTTGKPKGVMIEHRNAVELINWSGAEFDSSKFEVMYAVTSYCFDLSVYELFYTLSTGKKIRILKNALDIKNHIGNDKKIILNTVPSVIRKLQEDNTDLKNVSFINMAGEVLPIELVKKLPIERIEVRNLYGPSEDTTYSTNYLIKDLSYKSILIGKPISNTQVYILDEYLQPVPVGVIGKLYVSGNGVARGYINKAELTAEKFVVNPFRPESRMYDTGDLACWLGDGNIEFFGRKDHQVKIRGYRIELNEIECAILQYSTALKQAVVEVKQINDEKVLVAYLVTSEVTDKPVLRNFLQKKLPDYMIPNFYMELENLPLNPNGKIDRKALPDISGDDSIRQKYLAPKNTTEEKLVAIWQEVLGIEKIGVRDNFFELGGHSLIVGQVINRTQKQLGKTVLFKTFFANPTIEALSQELQEDGYQAIPQAPEAVSYPLTASQTRLWVLSQLEGGSLAYNMPAAVKLTGSIVVEKLKESFKRLLVRHEILRTSFKTNEEGEIRQYILPVEQINFDMIGKDFSSAENKEEAIAQYLNEKISEPFDLEQAPLFNVSLIKREENEHIIFLSLHHIVGDGWSMELIIAEVVKVYNALVQGKEFNLPELTIQYKDYTVWLNESVQQEKQKAAEHYWLQQFSGELPVLALPSFKARPVIQTYNGEHVTHRFSNLFLEKLKMFSKEQNVTLFMTLMAGVNILLHKYTNQQDIIIGTPLAGREHPDLENQLGLYLNTLAIRTRFKAENSFLDVMAIQKETLLGAYEHQRYPFDGVIGQLNLKRDTSRSALFDVLVILQNQEQLKNINNEELINLKIENYDFNARTSKFDISFTFMEGDNLELIIEYNTDIYELYLIERMFAHFENILTQSIEHPHTAIENIEYLTAAEKNELLNTFNNTEVRYSNDKTVIDLFEEQVLRTPHQPALAFEDIRLTYQELNEKANQLAYYLRRNYAIKGDDLIGIKLERSEQMLIAILGVLKAGAAYVPIDPHYPQERIAYIEKNSNSKVILSEQVLENWKEAIKTSSKENLEKIAQPNNLAYIIYTSGTTGNPKGVMVEHGSLSNFIHGMNGALTLDENDHLLAITSISFDISILELLWTLTRGMQVTLKSDKAPLTNFNFFLQDHSIAMDFSLFYFSSQQNASGNSYQFLKESAIYADQQGYSAIWLPERHFHEFGGIFPNPSVLGAGLSTITNQIEIRSGSVVLPLHDAVRVAEEWSVVDNLSNGRVSLSIASGWHADDFVFKPDHFRNRQQIMYDQIEELKTLWKGGAVKRINGMNEEIDVKIFPRPVNPDMELYITSGGNSETFRSAGKIGANILTHFLGQELKDLAKNIQIYKQALLDNGHSVEKGKVVLMLHTYIGTDLTEVKNTVKEPFKSYLRSSVGLIQNLAKTLDKDIRTIHEGDLNALLELAFERYWQTSALLGTPDTCKKIVSDIHAIGVTEIACLVDFGIADADVIKGLDQLTNFKNKYKKDKTGQPSASRKMAPITSMQITPSYLEALLEDETSRAFIKSLKNIIVGGEKFAVELLTKVKEKSKTGATIYNMYGPTETTIWSTVEKADSESRLNIGRPVQNTQIYILDGTKKICPIGVAGELCIGGEGLSRGYYKDEKLTAEKFIDVDLGSGILKRVYKTGDLARWLPDGTLAHLGRMDNQVKINGFRIELGEIESVLLQYEKINQAVVIANENGSGRKYLSAYFVSTVKINTGELKIFIEQKLPSYMIPNHLIQLDELPLTPNGKIDRKHLPAFGELLTNKEYAGPKNEVELILVGIWSNVLNIPFDKIGIKDNFFELGGNSLLMIKMLNYLNKEFKTSISLLEGYKLPNIYTIAHHIQSRDDNHAKEQTEDTIEELYNVMEESYNLLNFVENEK